MSEVSPQKVRELLIYDPNTGAFRWRVTLGNRAVAGSPAGGLDKSSGYIRVRINGRNYQCQRLAWAYMLGRWPEKIVDHENRVRSDNRWINLRAATRAQNNQNREQRAGASGFKGVHQAPGSSSWTSKIQVNGKQIHIGSFATAEEAAAAYEVAAKKHHGEFAL